MKRITVRVLTNTKTQEIIPEGNNHYKIKLNNIPEQGKANKELEQIMKKYLKKNVRIIKGHTKKNKTLEVT